LIFEKKIINSLVKYHAFWSSSWLYISRRTLGSTFPKDQKKQCLECIPDLVGSRIVLKLTSDNSRWESNMYCS